MIDDLRQLRYLVALGDHATLSGAAERLGITKSALSQSVQRIEDVYGVQLFIRGRRGIQITAYGELLVDSARRSIAIFDDTNRQLHLVKNLEMGRLVIGIDPVLSEVLLSRVLIRMLRDYPKLRYVQKSGFWSEQMQGLDSGAIDFFIGIRPDTDVTEFDVTPIMLPGLLVYCRDGHPLTTKANLALHEIYDYPILGPSMPRWFYENIDQNEGQSLGHESSRDLFLLTNDEGTMRNIVRHSDAISGGFWALIRSDVETRRLAVLPIRSAPFCAPIPCIIASGRRRPLPPSARKVIEVVMAVAAELVSSDV